MSAIDEWKDQLIPKDLSLAEEVIDEQQAEIDELREKNVRLVEDNKILKIALKLDGIEDFVAELNRRSKGE